MQIVVARSSSRVTLIIYLIITLREVAFSIPTTCGESFCVSVREIRVKMRTPDARQNISIIAC